MCLAIFLAADAPLPLARIGEGSTQMYVVAIPLEQESIRKQFSKRFVYEITTEEGCASGFDYDPDYEREPTIAEENEMSRTLLSQLSVYLTAALNIVGVVELYAGHCDEMGLPPTHRGAITPEHLILSRLSMADRKFFIVSK